MPMRRAVEATRQAISPRFAMRIFLNIQGSPKSRCPDDLVVHGVKLAGLAFSGLAEAQGTAHGPVAGGPAHMARRADGKGTGHRGSEELAVEAFAGALADGHLVQGVDTTLGLGRRHGGHTGAGEAQPG